MGRESYLRGELAINHKVTARCLDRVADMLDIADTQTVTAVYAQLPETQDDKELATAWCWTAILLADMVDIPSDVIHQLATGIRSMYAEGVS